MRTIEVNIYKFEELSEQAKTRAKEDYLSENGYLNADEAFTSIAALTKHFSGKIHRYNVDFFNCSHSKISFIMPDDMGQEEIQQRLESLGSFDPESFVGKGDCKLTGYCSDEDCIDGFRIAFMRDKETDLEKLMQAAFRSWLKAAQADCEDFYSDEAFGEHCEANEYEFYESGKLYK